MDLAEFIFLRWYFDTESGECLAFEYSGCLGNRNRFMAEEDCANACRHRTKQWRSRTTCKMLIEQGNCSAEEHGMTNREDITHSTNQ